MLLVTLLAAPFASAAPKWCDPPPPQKFDNLADQFPHLKVWAAKSFPSAVDAALFLASLPPDQQQLGAQVVPLRRSMTFVVVYKLTLAEHQARPIPIPIVAWVAIDLQRAVNAHGIDWAFGLDGAIVATRDIRAPFLVLSVVAGPCPIGRRRATSE